MDHRGERSLCSPWTVPAVEGLFSLRGPAFDNKSMIAFGSLLLGLIVGPQPVELLVGEAVFSVEVRLDGRSLGRHQGEDWSFRLDFGPELAPHELVGIAYDEDHREIARVRQWVNLPRHPAEAAVFVEGGQGGRGAVARLSWESVVSSDPVSVKVTFDGRPLAVDDPHRIPLPPHDPDQLHFLRAELDFSDNVSSVVEVSLAGGYSDRIITEMTAIPVLYRPGSKLPPVDKLQGRFSKQDKSLAVLAVEKGPADVVIVEDGAAHSRLRSLARTSDRDLRSRARLGNLFRPQRNRQGRRSRTSLPPDLGLRFLWPYATRHDRAGPDLDVFPPSEEFTQRDADLFWLLSHERAPRGAAGPQRLADAVAAAGLMAAGRNRRRAVVLIVDAGSLDGSRFDPVAVRRYLRYLGVPLLVWSLESEASAQPATWGEVVDASSLEKLEQAVADLYRVLDHQRIIWLDGAHLPQDIVVSEGDIEIDPSLVLRKKT